MNVKKLTRLALLTSVALIIFIIELRLPNLIPIPGVKLGLANIITVYAVYRYKPSEVFMIVLIRIVLGSIFGGTMVSFLYSLGGSICCLVGMLLLQHIIPESFLWISSMCGAVLHNIGQLTVAAVVMHTTAILLYFPVLTISGIISGLFTGVCAQILVKRGI